MTAGERAQILVTARLLQAAENIDWLTTGLTLVAAAAVAFGPSRSPAAIAALLLGLIAKLYALRVSFDARLVGDIARERLTTAELDEALVALSFARPDKTGRDWTDRCRGAKRLVVIVAIVTAAQTLAIALICLKL
jgi:hypothetical protein